jgi:ComF family protein
MLLLVSSGIEYVGPTKKLIRRFKYDDDRLVAKDLGVLLRTAWTGLANELDTKSAILLPVPLHWRRQLKRGYNQAELVALELARSTKTPAVTNGMRRTKSTTPQNKLTREQREDNLTNAFRGAKRRLKNRDVVIVDDVCTSGATLIACATEAYRCGANRVFGLTIARAILLNKNLQSAPSIRASGSTATKIAH